MEENSKYYTPTIEEFHVGFEYEQFDNNQWKQNKLEVDGAERFFVMLSAYELKEFVRVKHLDREDIESLFWIMKSEKSESPEDYDKYTTGESRDYWILEHYTDENPHAVQIYNQKSDKEHDNHYHGPIKNKSELKKLMQMLNIKIQ